MAESSNGVTTNMFYKNHKNMYRLCRKDRFARSNHWQILISILWTSPRRKGWLQTSAAYENHVDEPYGHAKYPRLAGRQIYPL